MSELPYKVGYGRPPGHSRFQKGQSGNPGGRSRVEIRATANKEKLLKLQFEVALVEWLSADEEVLRKARPSRAMDSLALRLALQGLDGGLAAQKMIYSILERLAGDCLVAGPKESADKPAAKAIGMEDCRELPGERYDEFRSRYNKAVAAGSIDALLAVVEDFDDGAEFPEAGNSAENS
jgi:hypothetical protein